jgi:hypothetical protein
MNGCRKGGGGIIQNTNTNTKNLFPPFPIRYNKMQKINTIINNRAQL